MCPARIECQSGFSFTLRAGDELGKHSLYFDELSYDEKQDLKGWLTVWGTRNGFKVAVWGRDDIFVFVSPGRIASSPPGHRDVLTLAPDNIYILSGGTKIIPLRTVAEEK